MPCLVARECTIICGLLCVHAVAKPTHAFNAEYYEGVRERKADKIAMLLVKKTRHTNFCHLDLQFVHRRNSKISFSAAFSFENNNDNDWLINIMSSFSK